MPETVGEIFRRIVKVLQTQNDDPSSDLNHPSSDINHPSSDINHPSSDYNHPSSNYNHPFASKQVRRSALRKLIHKYLSDYLSYEQAEELVNEYIP